MSVYNTLYGVHPSMLNPATLEELRDPNLASRYPQFFDRKPNSVPIESNMARGDELSVIEINSIKQQGKRHQRLRRFLNFFNRKSRNNDSSISPIMSTSSSYLELFPTKSRSIKIKQDSVYEIMNTRSRSYTFSKSSPMSNMFPSIHEPLFQPPYELSISSIYPVHSDSGDPYDYKIEGICSNFGSSPSDDINFGQFDSPNLDSALLSPRHQQDIFNEYLTYDFSEVQSHYSFLKSPPELLNKRKHDVDRCSLPSPITMNKLLISSPDWSRNNTKLIKSINSGRVKINKSIKIREYSIK